MVRPAEQVYCWFMTEMIQPEAAKMTCRDAFHWQTQSPVVAIVDDDEAVRESTSSLIRSMGFTAAVFHRPKYS
jgi:hypothetical protein